MKETKAAIVHSWFNWSTLCEYINQNRDNTNLVYIFLSRIKIEENNWPFKEIKLIIHRIDKLESLLSKLSSDGQNDATEEGKRKYLKY